MDVGRVGSVVRMRKVILFSPVRCFLCPFPGVFRLNKLDVNDPRLLYGDREREAGEVVDPSRRAFPRDRRVDIWNAKLADDLILIRWRSISTYKGLILPIR